METSHPSLQATVHLPGCLTLHNNNMGPERCLHLSEKESFRHWGLMSFYASWRKGTYSLLGGAELPRTLRHQRPKTHKPYCCCLALSCVLLFCDPIDCSPPGSFFFFFFFSVRSHRQQPTRLPCPWDSPGKNTGVGCHFLLHRLFCLSDFSRQEYWSGLPLPSPGIFLTQGSNPNFLYCRWVLYHWATGETPQITLEMTVLSPEGSWEKLKVCLKISSKGEFLEEFVSRVRNMYSRAFQGREKTSLEQDHDQNRGISLVILGEGGPGILCYI